MVVLTLRADASPGGTGNRPVVVRAIRCHTLMYVDLVKHSGPTPAENLAVETSHWTLSTFDSVPLYSLSLSKLQTSGP